ncbi:hypothetical protein CF319_g5552 [Tilletia indica]|nr:hypothetical protein CF319_g5552 [Tilletia indica]
MTSTTSEDHQRHPLHERRQEKLEIILQAIRGQGLTFHEFVTGAITATSPSVRLSTTKWITSHASSDASKYGPTLLVAAIVQEVRDRATSEQTVHFETALTELSTVTYEQEMDAAAKDPWLHLPHSLEMDDEEGGKARLTGDFRKLNAHYAEIMPATVRLMRTLVQASEPLPAQGATHSQSHPRPSAGSDIGLEDEGPEEDETAMELEVSKKEMTIISAISCLLAGRSQTSNRFQMTVGVLFALMRVPRFVVRFLNLSGFTVSDRTATRALESISSQSLRRAREVMETNALRTVLLFDNINIYVRHSNHTITASNTSIALTSRSIFTLPSQCHPISATDMSKLCALDRTKMTLPMILGDDDFLHRATVWHVSAALIPLLEVDDARRQKLRAALRRRMNQRTIQQLKTERTTVVPLKVMNVNEGTVIGTKKVLDQTMSDFGLDLDDPDPFLVAGDLLTVLNVFAARSAAGWEKRARLQLSNVYPVAGPWHLLLNWVYSIFHTYGTIDGPTSLERLRQVLGRGKTDLDMRKPQFNEGWALLRQVWTGKVLSAVQFELEQDRESWAGWNPSAKDFFSTVERVVNKHMSQTAAHEAQCMNDPARATSVLFMRDCSLGWEYDHAIRAGDIGRMGEMEKFLCLSFYGCGQTKYGSLLLDRALVDQCFPDVARTLRSAQLINIHGKENGWQGADHYQEILNKRLKMYTFSHVPNQIVTRYEDRISASVGVGEELVEEVQTSLGWYTSRRKKKERTPKEDVFLLAGHTKSHGLNAARSLAPSSSGSASAQLNDIAKDKHSAAEQARLVWKVKAEQDRRAKDIISDGCTYLLNYGLQRFRNKTQNLPARDADVYDLATGRQSPPPPASELEHEEYRSEVGENEQARPTEEEISWAEEELRGEGARGDEDEGYGTDDSGND